MTDKLPGIDGITSLYDVRTVSSHQHLDPVVERADFPAGRLALLNDLEWLTWSTAQWIAQARALSAAVWVHAVNQAILKEQKQLILTLCCKTYYPVSSRITGTRGKVGENKGYEKCLWGYVFVLSHTTEHMGETTIMTIVERLKKLTVLSALALCLYAALNWQTWVLE